jgi:hypothetical protein
MFIFGAENIIGKRPWPDLANLEARLFPNFTPGAVGNTLIELQVAAGKLPATVPMAGPALAQQNFVLFDHNYSYTHTGPSYHRCSVTSPQI